MTKEKLINKSFRVDHKQLDRIKKQLGLDESKAIRACMNCTENVIHGFFGGEVREIFRRHPKHEERPLYQN